MRTHRGLLDALAERHTGLCAPAQVVDKPEPHRGSTRRLTEAEGCVVQSGPVAVIVGSALVSAAGQGGSDAVRELAAELAAGVRRAGVPQPA